MQTIIGLGNPGDKYAQTRHNVGFVVLDELARQKGLEWTENKKFQAQIIKTPDLLLLKPLTYMNNSGQAVAAVLAYYKILQKKYGLLAIKNLDLADLVTVVHDELDIELGKYKISVDSRAAGHRGVQSIIDHLKTKNFTRLRVGVKTETLQHIPVDKFVLQRFNREEEQIIKDLLPTLTALLN